MQKLKKQIKKYLQNPDYQIFADWDAGGDQTPCNIRIFKNGQEQKYDTYSDFHEDLRWQIIMTLDLPNAGETYHKGKGEIKLGENDAIIIAFSAKASQAFYESEEAYEKAIKEIVFPRGIEVQYEDPFRFKPYLHRIQIEVTGDASEDGYINVYPRLRVIHGDEIPFTDAAKKYYQKKLEKVLQGLVSHIKTHNQDAKDFWICNAHLSGILNPDLVVRFQTDFGLQEITEIFENESVVLIP